MILSTNFHFFNYLFYSNILIIQALMVKECRSLSVAFLKHSRLFTMTSATWVFHHRLIAGTLCLLQV